ncbi:MAG: DUF3160 domain-containing protein [Deltaproteobacteria bacterium]|nr:DUF3160 domain-containing protein [Deltaproteobacteria bacterium]
MRFFRMPCLIVLVAVAAGGCRKRDQGGTDVPSPTPSAGDAAGPGPAPGPTATGVTLAPPAGAGAASGFERHYRYEAPAYEAKLAAGTLPVPLDGVEIPEFLARQYGLDETARQRLSDHGFVVTAGPLTRQVDEIYTIYEALSGNVPVFVTADTALHLYHLVFDSLLMSIEQHHLIGMLTKMIGALRAKALESAAGTGSVADAALDNVAVFDVIRKLLDPAAEVEGRVAERVAAELALIEQHAGFAKSPVFGYDEDYSQYVPRGHYTRSEALRRYFRAMMWLGRMSFLLKASGDPDGGLVDEERARHFVRMAALLSRGLQEAQADGVPAVRLWERIYSVTAFFAGFSDDLTPVEVRPVVDALFEAAGGVQALAEPANVDLLRARMAALRSPAINSGTAAEANIMLILENGNPEELLRATARTTGMRIMGQRYTPDADVMGRLAVPAVGAPLGPRDPPPFTLAETQQGPARGFARGLDVMLLLGAPRARPILEELGDAQYAGYDAALERARGVFPPDDSAVWHGNLYWAWLEVLRDYVRPRPTPSQAFETGAAWADRTLTAALASWAQLRHDTILYVKQPYAEGAGCAMGGPEPPPPPKGFVEPNPEFFARLIALNEMTRGGLRELELLPEQADRLLGHFGEVLGKLRDLAVKEVEDRAIDQADNDFLIGFGASCAGLVQGIAGLTEAPPGPPDPHADGEAYHEADTKTTLVADVMTCVDAGEVLEEGTGYVELITVAFRAPGRGDTFVAAGPALTYYEFRWPLADRLTDEKWRAMLAADEAPAPPPWVCSFRSPCPAPVPAP